jgi:hypothetical protein
MQAIPEDRSLKPEERALTKWLLEHGTAEAPAFLSQLGQASVISR